MTFPWRYPGTGHRHGQEKGRPPGEGAHSPWWTPGVLRPPQDTCWFSAKTQRSSLCCQKSFLCLLINPNPIWSMNNNNKKEFCLKGTILHFTSWTLVNSFYKCSQFFINLMHWCILRTLPRRPNTIPKYENVRRKQRKKLSLSLAKCFFKLL